MICRYDARVKAKTTGGGKGGGGLGDLEQFAYVPPLTEGLKNYFEGDLNLRTDLKYNQMGRVNPWNFGTSRAKAIAVLARLRAAMEKDENLRVFVACGYCDLATPFVAAKYTMATLGPKPLQDRVTLAYYDGGHMMYTVRQSHERLKDDMAKFILGHEREATR